MNPAALYLASGDSLYPGASLLLFAILWPWLPVRRLRMLHSLSTWLGLTLIVVACPPISDWIWGVFLVASALWFITKDQPRSGSWGKRLNLAATSVLLIWVLAVPTSEFLHRRMPRVSGQASDHLVVIGDSISAGLDARTPAWPIFFQQQTGISVRNLSRPGAGVIDAQRMAAQVAPRDTLILIEIGGNDLLSGTSSAEFSHDLDSLLASLSVSGRTLVMFELPLLPHKIGFGQAQRRLSERYGVFLIPRHFFTRILSGGDATSDGLHLSNLGARRMAALVARTVSPVLKTAEPATS
jgi:lysophospholipase L1-like esterase